VCDAIVTVVSHANDNKKGNYPPQEAILGNGGKLKLSMTAWGLCVATVARRNPPF
jgi:hypothetical protein